MSLKDRMDRIRTRTLGELRTDYAMLVGSEEESLHEILWEVHTMEKRESEWELRHPFTAATLHYTPRGGDTHGDS